MLNDSNEICGITGKVETVTQSFCEDIRDILSTRLANYIKHSGKEIHF